VALRLLDRIKQLATRYCFALCYLVFDPLDRIYCQKLLFDGNICHAALAKNAATTVGWYRFSSTTSRRLVNAHGGLSPIETPITLAADSNIECRAFPARFENRSQIRNYCSRKLRLKHCEI